MGDGLDDEFFDQLIPQPALREGLPPGYRMRHDAHWVDRLSQPAAPPIRSQDEIELVYRPGIDDYSRIRRLQLVAEWLAPVGGLT